MLVKGQLFDVKINKRNIQYYKDSGYTDIELRDVITVKAEDLQKGSKRFVDVKCDYCGKIVEVQYKDYLNYKYDKYSCAKCRSKKSSEYTLSKRQDYLYNGIFDVCNKNGYRLMTPKSRITNSESRVQYECPKHGIHETKSYSLFLGHRCTECVNEYNHELARKTPDEVYDDFNKYGGILLNKEDYKGWNYKNLKVICPSCGEIFTTSYGAFTHMNGQRCPKCASNISRHEYIIKKYLESKNISFNMGHRFIDCRYKIPLPFDFYIQKYNMCIEYDGEGHYIPIRRGGITEEESIELLNDIKERDKIKTDYCKNNEIKLIRIPYWDKDRIFEIIDEELLKAQQI